MFGCISSRSRLKERKVGPAGGAADKNGEKLSNKLQPQTGRRKPDVALLNRVKQIRRQHPLPRPQNAAVNN